MKRSEMFDYRDAGCEFFASGPPAFFAVFQLTRGDPCTTGCSWFAGGKCAAYRKLNAPPPRPQEIPGETVRQEAARKGLSISEVRRQRAKAA